MIIIKILLICLLLFNVYYMIFNFGKTEDESPQIEESEVFNYEK